ncbi:outer dynein arm-docking complex subunit 4-like isoform X2 [Cydia splendana]|uniref:outer dynein arm-docking complex subunit 4-like isoform X2 n=1 Tax=Cydia splendana TaxID=1100963 RepID=UPI00300D01C3
MKMVRKKLELEERPICNAVTVYRTRGHYLQRLELFDKAIQAYNEALRWNKDDVHSLLGRSVARAKATYYNGALADAIRATEIEPQNVSALHIRAQTAYETCAFERSLVLSHRGQLMRKLPPNFAECARNAEETIRVCTGESAGKVLQSVNLLRSEAFEEMTNDEFTPIVIKHQSRMSNQAAHKVQDMSRIEQQKKNQMTRLMASKYLERMAHDKYFLTSLCKDERLVSANKKGSVKLQELATNALMDVENRQAVLRERRPMYATSPAESAARARLRQARKEQQEKARRQNVTDATRLLSAAVAMQEEHDTIKCLELAEFAMQQIARKPAHLLPDKEKFLQELYKTVALAFLDQKRVAESMSEADREKKAFFMLGIALSREPSRDSLWRARPMAPHTDVKNRLRTLERSVALAERASERCYILHELARLYADTKKAQKARYYSTKCQAARSSGQSVWLLNATFLLARCHVLQNNRPDARAALLEGSSMARAFGYGDVSEFFDTCANVSTEGEILLSEEPLTKREKDMVSLMQDDDLKSAAEHLFRRMSTVPVARRFSIMPGARMEAAPAPTPGGRRASIMPRAQPAVRHYKTSHPLGFQDFD